MSVLLSGQVRSWSWSSSTVFQRLFLFIVIKSYYAIETNHKKSSFKMLVVDAAMAMGADVVMAVVVLIDRAADEVD